MRKAIAVVALVASFAVVGVSVALAANLQSSFVGTSCPGGGTGAWHFVNTQTGGGSSSLTTTWSTSLSPVVTAPSVVNRNVTQYNVTHDGTLLSATTSLGGKIVVSDLDCGEAPPPPPPPPPPPAP
jgi:hypothetical protein